MDPITSLIERLGRLLEPIALAEAGRVLSAANEGKVRAAIAALSEVLSALGAADAAKKESAIAEARALLEADFSYSDRQQLLRGALKTKLNLPKDGWVYVRDCYDDAVIYEVDDPQGGATLYKASYALDDAGTVTLGDPAKVQLVTSYVVISESGESLDEAAYDMGTRMAMAKRGHAMKDGAFPIANVADLQAAIKAYGRASDKAAAKAHIVKRAKALKATDRLPADWEGSTRQESADLELAGDLIPLTEKAVREDGTVPIKVISPGWGSSGYYPADVLKRDGPKVFPAGTHMYLDHPTPEEEASRPERSLKDLAATLTSGAAWQDEGVAGPGLYAEARVRSDLAPLIEELAPSIGVSIRAFGRAKDGEAEGRKGKVVESLHAGRSVDFVTLPGRGGAVLELVEAARVRRLPQDTPKEESGMADAEELKTLRESLAGQEKANEAMAADLKALGERLLLRDTRDLVLATLTEVDLPDITRRRLVEHWETRPVLKDGALDREATVERVREAARAELAYLAEATGAGSGRIRGMGGTPAQGGTAEEAQAKLAESLGRLPGMSAEAAKVAANGRA
jgi:hypothetical protein